MKKLKIIFTIIAMGVFLILIICDTDCVFPSATCSEYMWGYDNGEFDHYSDIHADHFTMSGIAYDPSGQFISPELIDMITDETEKCLIKTFNSSVISAKIAEESYCERVDIKMPIDRKSFVIKIVNDWHLNCDKTQELLPVHADDSACLAKGELPNIDCPCCWRAGIKCPNILITTPAFYLYKDVLIRFTTGCANPWGSQELSKCATPSTASTSDGTSP
jgi:hypothetical protein